jgi:hypothetical protein
VNTVQVRSAERALSVGTWLIVCGAMLYSVLTVTPLMAAHTPKKWDWTAPILPLVVDAAVVIVVRLDSVLARLGGHGGRWPIALRWMTGCMTLALNVANSALARDLVGVAVHAVAPLLLIVTAETGLAYRRAITTALAALEERQRAEREAVQRAVEERREAAQRRQREEREHAAQLAREQREHELNMTREATEREERRARQERDEHERRERAHEQQRREREQAERDAAQQRERERRDRVERERRERQEAEARREREREELLSRGPAEKRLDEDLARRIVTAAFEAGMPVRAAAELCGWSVGWVSTRYQEQRDHHEIPAAPALEGAAS